MYEVHVFAYDQFYQTIFVEAETDEEAEDKVSVLNGMEPTIHFQLTGMCQC